MDAADKNKSIFSLSVEGKVGELLTGDQGFAGRSELRAEDDDDWIKSPKSAEDSPKDVKSGASNVEGAEVKSSSSTLAGVITSS